METCWTLVKGAAAGDAQARDGFALTYLPVVRSYLGARWRQGPLRDLLDDAVQDVFMDCLRDNGSLNRVDKDGRGRFRSWLFAVTRNVARRYEERDSQRRQRHEQDGELKDEPARDATLSVVFDRAWAQTIIRRAAIRQENLARDEGRKRRVELLRLRFHEGLPIREIATLWGEDAAQLHHEYAKARNEFKEALRLEVAEHGSQNPGEIEKECAAILAQL